MDTQKGKEWTTDEVAAVLHDCRADIDRLDDQILEMLGQRFAIIRRVATIKRDHAIPMMQQGRVTAVEEHYMRTGAAHGVDEQVALAVCRVIVRASCALEDTIIGRAVEHPARSNG